MPAATGRLATPSPPSTVHSTPDSLLMTRIETIQIGAAATNHRSCWRSSGPHLRYRKITESAASASASSKIHQAYSPAERNAMSSCNGFFTPATLETSPGLNSRPSATAPSDRAASHATGRHRRDGSRPVGKTRRRKAPMPITTTGRRSASHAAQAPPGSDPGVFRSAYAAYSCARSASSAASPAVKKSHPTAFPGRRERIKEPTAA